MGNDNKGHSGQQVTVRTPANGQAVKSTRRLSQEVGTSWATVQRVIHTDLHKFPYKVPILQKQTDANKRERVEFCQRISERIENNPDVPDLIQFSDEAHFRLSGHVNKQNMRFGESQQPHEHTQRPLSQENLTVLCAVGKRGIFGHTFSSTMMRVV